MVFKLQSGQDFVTETKGNNPITINARVIALVSCTLSNADHERFSSKLRTGFCDNHQGT